MEELKNILNKTSECIYSFLRKIFNTIKRDSNSLLIKSIIKIIVLIIIYFIIGLIAEGMISIGTYIIYEVGTTARSLLSSVWATVVNFTYFLFIIISLYKLMEFAKEDNKFLIINKNSKKDKETKNKVFLALDILIKIISTILLIPLFLIDIALLFALGILFGYLKQGIYLYSFFLAIIGLIIFFTVIIFIIKNLLSENKSICKSYLYLFVLSALLIATSSISVLFETAKYKNVNSLTSDFNSSVTKYEYALEKDKNYIISNNDSDMNMSFVIDDDLDSDMEIDVKHYDTNEIKNSLKDYNDKTRIAFVEDLDLEFSDSGKLFNLGVTCIKEKKLYNYTLLKYAQIEVRVSREYAENIKFVNRVGREYKPYERDYR